MIKFISLALLLSVTLFANQNEKFFNESDKNALLCRAGYDVYVKISQKNSTIETINGSKYFHYKDRDRYFPLAGCHPIEKEDKALIF